MKLTAVDLIVERDQLRAELERVRAIVERRLCAVSPIWSGVCSYGTRGCSGEHGYDPLDRAAAARWPQEATQRETAALNEATRLRAELDAARALANIAHECFAGAERELDRMRPIVEAANAWRESIRMPEVFSGARGERGSLSYEILAAVDDAAEVKERKS